MDDRTQRLYYNLCNPEEPLSPDNERNVDLDSLGNADQSVRGLKWAAALGRRIEYAVADAAVERPACEYFTGLPGSGKSTELWRLAQRLQRRDGANLLTVRVDAEDLLDITDTVDVSDIRVAIVYAVERRILEAEGRMADEALKDGAADRLTRLVETFQVGGKLDLGLPGAKLVLDMKSRPSLRRQIRERVASHTTTFLRESNHELELLRDRALKAGYAGVVVILDSLEKLRGTSTSFQEVLNSAEQVFSEGAPYLQTPLHMLYTVPPALILRLKMDVHFMPMIKLWQRDGVEFPLGFQAALAILRKRIPNGDVLREIFGVADDEALEVRLRRLVSWSAGYPRELVRLLRNAVVDGPLGETGFRRLLGMAGDSYRRPLLVSDFDLLARVAVHHDLVPVSEGERAVADRLLSNQIVLRYQNDSEWYDVHPAVRDVPGLKEAMQRLQGAAGDRV